MADVTTTTKGLFSSAVGIAVSVLVLAGTAFVIGYAVKKGTTKASA